MRWVAVALFVLTACGNVTPAPTGRTEASEPRDGSVRINGAVMTSPSATPRTDVPSPGWTEDCAGRLLVIFDRSGSMGEDWPTSGEPRYRVAADALVEAITPLADHLIIGAITFPTLEEGHCGLVDPIDTQFPFRDGPGFLRDWVAYWSSHTPYGSTPLDLGFLRADEALPLDSHTAVVVLTDGQPTCGEAISAAEHAASWLSDGIKTYVVGLPGLDDPGVLDEVAAAGGTGTYLPVDDPERLEAELRSIAHGAIEQSCGP